MTAVEAQPAESEPAVQCARCEYSLRGLPRDGRCPECGTPAELSWQRYEIEQAAGRTPLHLAPPGWLRKMGIGCLALASMALLSWLDAISVTGMIGDVRDVAWLGAVVGISGLAASTIGLWLLGAREPLAAHLSARRPARFAIRGIALLLLVLPFSIFAVGIGSASLGFYHRLSMAMAACAGVVTCLVMYRLADAARRVPRRGLARCALLMAWVAPIAWIAHTVAGADFEYEPAAAWALNPHAGVGFAESILLLPYSLTTKPRVDPTIVAGWGAEALISLGCTVVLLMSARMFFAAARFNPEVHAGRSSTSAGP